MLTIETKEKKDIISLQVSGEFNLHNLSEIETVWEACLKKQPRIIAFDFTQIQDIDSMGISHLVKFSKKAIMEGIDVMLYGLNEKHRNFFQLAGVDRFFNILSTAQFDEMFTD